MSIHVEWHNNSTDILYCQFTSKWTRAECNVFANKVFQLTKERPYRLDFIVDMRDASLPPVGFLQDAARAADKLQLVLATWHLAVIITSNMTVKSYLASGKKLSWAISEHCRLANSLDQATQIITADRFYRSNAQNAG